MYRPSLGVIASALFAIYFLYSSYNLIKLFSPPVCRQQPCVHYYLNKLPNLELICLTSLSSQPKARASKLVHHRPTFDYNKEFSEEITLTIPGKVRRNGTYYMHIILVPSQTKGDGPNIADALKHPDVTVLSFPITSFAIPTSPVFNLLQEESAETATRPVTHLKTHVSFILLTDKLSYNVNEVPGELYSLIKIASFNHLLPIMQEDFLHSRLKDLVPVEATPQQPEKLTLSYSPTSIGKLLFLMQIQVSLAQIQKMGFTDKDVDEVKGMFADSNLYLLILTIFVGSVHLLFDLLSFKNDISFWQSNKSMAGLSTRSTVWRAFSQVVIFLYLADEGTSLFVLIPCGIAALIEFWKVQKVLRRRRTSETAEERATRHHDEEAMRYLAWVLWPICVAGAAYSLLYQPHRSWYSWTINSLVTGVYAFGFLFMLPQLFINYRLKSVAALPWRAFTYRAFNTFIDDLFAFIITMPMSHRIACFRDDVVFLVYLYQRWLYPVDETRSDEHKKDM